MCAPTVYVYWALCFYVWTYKNIYKKKNKQYFIKNVDNKNYKNGYKTRPKSAQNPHPPPPTPSARQQDVIFPWKIQRGFTQVRVVIRTKPLALVRVVDLPRCTREYGAVFTLLLFSMCLGIFAKLHDQYGITRTGFAMNGNRDQDDLFIWRLTKCCLCKRNQIFVMLFHFVYRYKI